MKNVLIFILFSFVGPATWAQSCIGLLTPYPSFFKEGLFVHSPMTTLNKDVMNLFSGTHFVNLRVRGNEVRLGAVFSDKVTEALSELYLQNGALYEHKISGVLFKDVESGDLLLSIMQVSLDDSDRNLQENSSNLIRIEEYR